MTWTAKVLTLFPDMFPGALGLSLAGRALKNGLWNIDVINIRDYAVDKHRRVDDNAAGGGPGMVMRADILAKAIDGACIDFADVPLIYLSPRGKPLTQERVKQLASGRGIVLVCGRFEGIDQRVIEGRGLEEISLGDFVMSGGELAALCLIDAAIRLQPGVMTAPESLEQESFEGGLLEYPQYTRPQSWEGLEIPPVLLSGHHKVIMEWRRQESERITQLRRPDLWQKHKELTI